MIDEIFKVDWPPDTMYHVHRDKLQLHRMQHLIMTHGHGDHLYQADLATRVPPFGHMPADDPGLDIWGPDSVITQLTPMISKLVPQDQVNPIRLHVVEPFTEYTLGDARLVPLPADHAAGGCLVHLFTRNGKTLFYGHDSGYYPEETWTYLAKYRLDIALLDCTNGSIEEERFHMGVTGVKKCKRRLQEMGCLHTASRVIVTHFSHNGGLLHHDLEAQLWPDGIEVAYDGMHVVV